MNLLKNHPEIEIFGREQSYKLHQLITKKHNKQSPLAYLLALGIPVASALSLATKLVSDAIRMFHTIARSIKHRKYAGDNIQTLIVDAAEYGRSILGVLVGALVAIYSPMKAAQLFLTIPADLKNTFLTSDEGARLYAMGNGIHAFFIRHNIDYRICSGTALGAFREKGIIRNDDDIDLMLHPESIDHFERLVKDGTFLKETGISIETQKVTGGWQCFYADSPKGDAGTPMAGIGKPFIDIFQGTIRYVGKKPIITYGIEKMYLQSPGDYFTIEEWTTKEEYSFGPTKMFGIGRTEIVRYIERCYGPSALRYLTRLYPHEVYSELYAHPLKFISILSKHPAPRYMKHTGAAPLDYDKEVYLVQTALAREGNDLDVEKPPQGWFFSRQLTG